MSAAKKIGITAAVKARAKLVREGEGAVGSLSRGLLLVDVLTRANGFMSLSDLAADSGLDASTAHRLLQTLIEHGYAVRDESSKRYLPGPRALLPLSLFHPVVQFKHEARSVLELLREQTNGTTALVLFIGKQRMVVDFVRGDQPLSPYYDTWLKSPLHGSASGKLLLAWLSDSEQKELLGVEPYKAFTAKTVVDPAVLSKYLAQVRDQGYAVARDDAYEGMIAIGAALMPQTQGRPIGCLVVVTSSQSTSPEREAEIADRLKAASQLLMNSAPSIQVLKSWTPRTTAGLSNLELAIN